MINLDRQRDHPVLACNLPPPPSHRCITYLYPIPHVLLLFLSLLHRDFFFCRAIRPGPPASHKLNQAILPKTNRLARAPAPILQCLPRLRPRRTKNISRASKLSSPPPCTRAIFFLEFALTVPRLFLCFYKTPPLEALLTISCHCKTSSAKTFFGEN